MRERWVARLDSPIITKTSHELERFPIVLSRWHYNFVSEPRAIRRPQTRTGFRDDFAGPDAPAGPEILIAD
jgi:hypothetical protein